MLEQWGVDGKVAKLISAIHTHSCMKHECAKEVVVTTRGGKAVKLEASFSEQCTLRR